MGRISFHPTLFDEVPRLDMAFFKKHDYLVLGYAFKTGITWNNYSGSVTVLIVNSEYDSHIKVKENGQRISIVSIPSNLGKGEIAFFICPLTGKRCRKLYYINGLFGHRTAFKGAFYDSQTQSKNQRNLETLFTMEWLVEGAYREMEKKHFKKYYNGKPTKRYKKLKSFIDKHDPILFAHEASKHLII